VQSGYGSGCVTVSGQQAMRVLRAPVVAVKWLLVGVAALLWLVVVPIVDAVWGAVRRLARLAPPRQSSRH
jgi:hypothetical protein